MWKILIDNPDTTTALGTFFSSFTALFAVFISIYSFYVQRMHNRLSICPRASLVYGDYNNDIYVKIRNDGLGPLVIIDFSINFGGREYHSILETFDSSFQEIVFKDYIALLDGRIISSNSELTIVRYQFEGNDKVRTHDIEKLRNHLSNMKFKVIYKDLYNKKQPICTRDGSWFHR